MNPMVAAAVCTEERKQSGAGVDDISMFQGNTTPLNHGPEQPDTGGRARH